MVVMNIGGLFNISSFSPKMHLGEKLKEVRLSTHCPIKIQIPEKDRQRNSTFSAFWFEGKGYRLLFTMSWYSKKTWHETQEH